MRLATYALRGRPSFGAVVGDGIVDLRGRLSRFSTLLEVFRAQAIYRKSPEATDPQMRAKADAWLASHG